MSGKKAKELRKHLSKHKFPVVTYQEAENGKLLEQGQDLDSTALNVPIKHVKVIRRLMKSRNLTINSALKRHCRNVGMIPKPKAEGQ